MRRGNFTSLADLEDQLRKFLKYFNDTIVLPFAWTYTGKPTTKLPRATFQPPHQRSLWRSKVKTTKQKLT